jgi:hypothetical protein
MFGEREALTAGLCLFVFQSFLPFLGPDPLWANRCLGVRREKEREKRHGLTLLDDACRCHRCDAAKGEKNARKK